MMKRRAFLGAAALAALTGCTSTGYRPVYPAVADSRPPTAMPAFYGPVTTEPYPIPAVPPGVVPQRYWRQRVSNPFPAEWPGTIIVDPDAYYLYLVEEGGTAMRYGVGVGRQGFSWSGDAVVQYKRQWPRWKVPNDMLARQPELEPYSIANGGMAPGLDNPLGARALYLFENGRDTLYRIHGSPEAASIGKAVSSGCIRLLNQDVIDLYNRVADGARVVVRPSHMPDALA
jgi:lipoprotein-anchoring transpeptidase ErfK/SrfK